MGKTKIEWATDTWNPVTGCDKVSAGCANCYAETFSERFRGIPGHHFENGFDLQLRPEMLDAPRHWKKPREIFVCSMSDLFHEGIPDEYIFKVFMVMAEEVQHTYMVLTKRTKRMAEWCAKWMPNGIPGHIRMGTTVENQRMANERIPFLLQVKAAVRFLSVEPMLEKIDIVFPHVKFAGDTGTRPMVDWVICGGESGPKARSFNIEWARDLRDQCKAVGVPFFMKQLGRRPYREWHGEGPTQTFAGRPVRVTDSFESFVMEDEKGGDMAEWPEDLRVRQFPKKLALL